jgi:hypothetical protein
MIHILFRACVNNLHIHFPALKLPARLIAILFEFVEWIFFLLSAKHHLKSENCVNVYTVQRCEKISSNNFSMRIFEFAKFLNIGVFPLQTSAVFYWMSLREDMLDKGWIPPYKQIKSEFCFVSAHVEVNLQVMGQSELRREQCPNSRARARCHMKMSVL